MSGLELLLGQVSVPPASDPLVRSVLRFVGLIVGAFVASGVAALLYRWYTRDIIPRALAVLFGAALVALYLNTIGLFGEFATGTNSKVFQPATVLYNAGALAGGALVSPGGRLVGDRIATDVFAVAGAKELDADVSKLVRAVGRVTTVTLPEDIEDIEAYDPVSEAVKEQLRAKTLLFPRRLSVSELRDRLVTRIKDDHGVGHVDVEIADDGTVPYLALGSRAAGLGPTLGPGTVAIAIRGDPGPGAAAGDPVQVWAVPKAATDDDAVDDRDGVADGAGDATTQSAPVESETEPADPTRVAFGELRGVAGDVATVALDEVDAERLSGAEEYRLVTLPASPHVDREFASLLRTADETMAVVTVGEGSALDGADVAAVDITVVAIRTPNRPVEAIPARSRLLAAGDTLYVVGRPELLRQVERQASEGAQTDGSGESGFGDENSDGEDDSTAGGDHDPPAQSS
ncbi:cation:proton antiporter regulatory subunit [Haloferax sp. S1W]|uniref:cation:proton antiporter regulatory subunit n=1 Tax=Haloferax sp. S1W TaxID=3377110 RepID=UPI0037CC624C